MRVHAWSATARRETEAFRRDGFLVVDRPLVSRRELDEVRRLLLPLFERFDTLPPESAYDLGDHQHPDDGRQIPEINDVLRFEPRLATTAAFARCRRLAQRLLGFPVVCTFDHAIAKPPRNGAATEWHQDLAYSPHLAGRESTHIWLALQDVDERNGCMQFVPRDPSAGLLPHRPRSDRSHALVTDAVDPATVVAAPLPAGGVTVHNLTTPHFTGPNTTDTERVAWILHFRRRSWRSLAKATLLRGQSRPSPEASLVDSAG